MLNKKETGGLIPLDESDPKTVPPQIQELFLETLPQFRKSSRRNNGLWTIEAKQEKVDSTKLFVATRVDTAFVSASKGAKPTPTVFREYYYFDPIRQSFSLAHALKMVPTQRGWFLKSILHINSGYLNELTFLGEYPNNGLSISISADWRMKGKLRGNFYSEYGHDGVLKDLNVAKFNFNPKNFLANQNEDSIRLTQWANSEIRTAKLKHDKETGIVSGTYEEGEFDLGGSFSFPYNIGDIKERMRTLLHPGFFSHPFLMPTSTDSDWRNLTAEDFNVHWSGDLQSVQKGIDTKRQQMQNQRQKREEWERQIGLIE